jgi:hypothetical protein
MRNLVLVGVLNARNNLLENFAGLILGQLKKHDRKVVITYLFSASDEIEELTACSVLQDHENLRLSVNEFKKFDNVRVVKSPENLELPFYFLENAILADLLLV